MDTLKKFAVITEDKAFDVCEDPDKEGEDFQVFKLDYKGEHYDYVYRNKSTGMYYLGEDSHLTSDDLKKLSHCIEKKINEAHKAV